MKAYARVGAALLLAVAALSIGKAARAESVVDMVNREASAVLVAIGTDDGVTEDDDYIVVDANGGEVARIYPFELYNRRFWSQPLDKKVFDRIVAGLNVRKAAFDREAHWELRYRGNAWRRQKARERLAAVVSGLERLVERSRELSNAIGTLATDLQDQVGKARGSEKLDAARKELVLLYEERDDLAEKRRNLSAQVPYPTRKIERLDRDSEKNDVKISDTLVFIREEEQSGVLPVFWASRVLAVSSSLQNLKTRADDMAQGAYQTLGAAEQIDGLIERTRNPQANEPSK